tara:strand:+ start:384 stop:1028 length:645 start_codon:yes stop_codon:yes gene_type:complete
MKYQDLVIKDGKFIGKFEEMYKKFPDPWNLLKNNKLNKNLNYQIILKYCDQIKLKKKTTLEIGCGYPQISYMLFKKGYDTYGVDISKTVIKRSKKKYPELANNLFVSDFLNFSLFKKINPNIIILSDISWYVLPELKKFIKWYKGLNKKIFLIHSLAVYNNDTQKYGKEYFYDLKTIKFFFKLNYISSCYVENIGEDKHAIFLGDNEILKKPRK